MEMLFSIIIFFGSAILVCVVIDRLRYRTTPEDLERARAERQRERTLLPSPDFDSLEKHFGSVPTELRTFYEKQDLILREGFYFVSETDGDDYDYIECFLPARLTSLERAGFKVKPNFFPIAEDGSGNLYVVDMASSETLSPVYFIDHEITDDPTLLADSLLKWASRPTREELEE